MAAIGTLTVVDVEGDALFTIPLVEGKTNSGGRKLTLGERSYATLPVPKGLPVAVVGGFTVSVGKAGKPAERTARDGYTGGERPKAKRYAALPFDVEAEAWTANVQVSADPRKPEEWSLYVSGGPGAMVEATPAKGGAKLAALAAKL